MLDRMLTTYQSDVQLVFYLGNLVKSRNLMVTKVFHAKSIYFNQLRTRI